MKLKKLLIGIVLLALILAGGLVFVRSRVDGKAFRSEIERVVLEKTGLPLTIKGEVGVSMLPLPTLYLPGVEIRDPDSEAAAPVPALSVDMVSVRATFWSIVSGHPDITGIAFDHPVLEIQRSEDEVIKWGWLKPELLQDDLQKSLSVNIADGEIVYRNAHIDSETSVKDIAVTVRTGAQPQASGGLVVKGHALKFSARTEAAQGSDGTMPVTISLSSDRNDTLSLEGTVNVRGDAPKINGKIALKSENIMGWFQQKPEEGGTFFSKFTADTGVNAKKTVMPVDVSGQWSQSGTSVKITVDAFNGLNSAGSGVIDAQWKNATPRIESTFNFSAVNYDYWKELVLVAFKDKDVSKAVTGYQANKDSKENPLPDDVTLSLDANAKQVYFGNQIWENARFSGTLDHAAVTIHQFDVVLPGDSSLSLFGIISQSSTREMRFEGTMETQGKSLRQLLTVFDASALDMPEGEFGQFNIRSNIYVAADQIRLSEADAKISDLHLNGGLVAYYDTMPRFEADVKLSDINFDYFRDAWRKQHKPGDKNETFFLQYDKSQSFNWLKSLKASVDFNVTVDKFRFLERDGDTAAFRIFAQAGEFGIYNVRLNYPGDTLEAGFSLDVKNDTPFFNILLNADTLDTAYFRAASDAPEKKPAETAEKKRWSEELIDMGWMEGWKGAFDVSIGKLKHHDWSVADIKFRAGLENNSLAIQSCALAYWQGKAQLSGSLYGGKVPGLSLNFTLSNADLQQMLQSLIGRDNISGKINANGTLATSGVNPLSWVSQAESEIVLNGQGVNVNGFNLQGVIDAVAVSRTAADVLNNVNLALVNGKTEMSAEGTLNVKNGLVRTPGITLKSGNVGGTLTGEIKLVPWKMDLEEIFQFTSMNSEKAPTMTVQLTGLLNKPDMGVDTASLEAYVAKRLTGGSASSSSAPPKIPSGKP
jgi:uncharacterized protein involved in outer membrane biogenesis